MGQTCQPFTNEISYRREHHELIENEVTRLPEPLRREVYDFARFLRLKSEAQSFNGLLLQRNRTGQGLEHAGG